MGQKHKRFRESRTLFPLHARHPQKSSQHVRACAAGDGAICSKYRIIVPYHGANPNTRNGASLRSPSPIMAPGFNRWLLVGHYYVEIKKEKTSSVISLSLPRLVLSCPVPCPAERDCNACRGGSLLLVRG